MITAAADKKQGGGERAEMSPASEPGEEAATPAIPDLFTSSPLIHDVLATASSALQDETVENVLPHMSGKINTRLNAHGVAPLERTRHVAFLRKQLGQLPGMFMSADPSRPWIFYWCLNGLAILGEGLDVYRDKLVDTVRPMQNQSGGFAGGFGQMSHLATTYATVLSLALVGGTQAYQVVDRRAMWKWLCELKQPDGGFLMAVGGEEDVRGAYCASVIISLLNLPLDLNPASAAYHAGHRTLFDGLADWVGQCQTYEGGIAAAPGLEAHGAYAFCALGCLSVIDSPARSVKRHLDFSRLISWLASRQNAPEGGFSGRTNKLVDGCYSHWVGGCWPLIEASLGDPEGQKAATYAAPDVSLYNRQGLIRYILCCCQEESPRGGLRDKPSKRPDAYHTNYCLSGLSSAQHKWTLPETRPEGSPFSGDQWEVAPCTEGQQIFDEQDRVGASHPVFVIPPERVDDIWKYFADKAGF